MRQPVHPTDHAVLSQEGGDRDADLPVRRGQAGIDPGQIDHALVQSYLTTAFMPDPELLIRTSGEKRISNFLLWQLAYTELYFSPVLWPDYRKEHFYEAIIDYQRRERRFGKVSKKSGALLNH